MLLSYSKNIFKFSRTRKMVCTVLCDTLVYPLHSDSFYSFTTVQTFEKLWFASDNDGYSGVFRHNLIEKILL